MNLFRWRILPGLWILALALACDAPGSKEPEVLRIASDATFAPFHFVDDSSDATGFELELARLVAARAGFSAELRVVAYDDLFTGLEEGDHDVVAATTGITAEREREFLFTTPHFRTCQAALVRVGDGEPASVAGLKGRRVGAAGVGTSALALTRVAGADPITLGKGQEGVPALLDGTIDALVVDEYDAVEAARASEGKLRVLAEPVMLESYAFVLRAGEEELRRALDGALAELEREGAIEALQDRFGVARDESWPVRLASTYSGLP